MQLGSCILLLIFLLDVCDAARKRTVTATTGGIREDIDWGPIQSRLSDQTRFEEQKARYDKIWESDESWHAVFQQLPQSSTKKSKGLILFDISLPTLGLYKSRGKWWATVVTERSAWTASHYVLGKTKRPFDVYARGMRPGTGMFSLGNDAKTLNTLYVNEMKFDRFASEVLGARFDDQNAALATFKEEKLWQIGEMDIIDKPNYIVVDKEGAATDRGSLGMCLTGGQFSEMPVVIFNMKEGLSKEKYKADVVRKDSGMYGFFNEDGEMVETSELSASKDDGLTRDGPILKMMDLDMNVL